MNSAVPKQYLEVAGATVLEHSLRALLNCEFIEAVVVALDPKDKRAAALSCLTDSRVVLVNGGEQRSDSVLAGLQGLNGLASQGDWVLVHDAARPCVSCEDVAALAQRVISTGLGGILAEPLVDTIKRSDINGLIIETLERDKLWRAQTPQMFRVELLRNALQSAQLKGIAITDEASAMELAGEAVQIISSSRSNLKITVPQDLQLAAFYLAQQHADSRP